MFYEYVRQLRPEDRSLRTDKFLQLSAADFTVKEASTTYFNFNN